MAKGKKKGMIASALDAVLHPEHEEIADELEGEPKSEAASSEELSDAPMAQTKTESAGEALASHPRFSKFQKGKVK